MNYSVFTSHYFTDWILTATTLLSLVVSWKRRAHKQLFLIQIYIAASLLLDILISSTDSLISNNKTWFEIDCVSLNLYAILEIILLSLFICNAILKRNIAHVVKTLCILYILFCFSIWIYFPSAITSNTPYLFAFEGILITTICLLYFYDLMHSLPKEGIRAKPDFWIASGILFYFSTTGPYYLMIKNFDYTSTINSSFTSVNYCLSTILFLSFIKAYLCPIRAQE